MKTKIRSVGVFSAVKEAGGIEAYCAKIDRRRESAQSDLAVRDSSWELPCSDRASQTARVLKMLRQAREEEGAVGAREFRRAGIRNHSAGIAGLRRKGFGIENTWWTNERWRRYPAYRLLFDRERDVIRKGVVK